MMRYVDIVTYRDLGLTAEEVAFLQDAAQAEFELFAEKTGYDNTNKYGRRDPFGTHIEGLKEPRFSVLDAINGMTLNTLLEYDPSHHIDGDRLVKTVLNNEGLGLSHSSYGAVSVTNPSGAGRYLVGAHTLSQYSKSISFNFADVECRDDDNPRLHSRAGRRLELALSAEQFMTMVRGDAGVYTPCGVQLHDGHWNDAPPQTSFEASGSIDFKVMLGNMLAPVTTEIDTLRAMVAKGASKKAEYAAFVEQCKRISQAYAQVVDSVLELGNATGQAEGKRAHEQFVADMNERLSQLKIEQTVQELLGLTQD